MTPTANTSIFCLSPVELSTREQESLPCKLAGREYHCHICIHSKSSCTIDHGETSIGSGSLRDTYHDSEHGCPTARSSCTGGLRCSADQVQRSVRRPKGRCHYKPFRCRAQTMTHEGVVMEAGMHTEQLRMISLGSFIHSFWVCPFLIQLQNI